MAKATARLTELTAQTATLAFHATSIRPYAGDFVGTLTIDRVTGWLTASELTATLRGEDAEMGFRLELALRATMTRVRLLPEKRH